MIFARYIGPQTLNWTVGKIYFAMAGVESNLAVDMNVVRILDDAVTWQEVRTDAGVFEFPEFIYAAVVKEVKTLMPGDVVRIVEASDGFLEVEKYGYLKADHFEVLDRTNVALGNKVRDTATGIWQKVSRLDNDLMLGFEGRDEMLSPEEFIFPVAGGSVLSEPMLKCVSGVDGELTEGKVYSPTEEREGLVIVLDDSGKSNSYMTERFSRDL